MAYENRNRRHGSSSHSGRDARPGAPGEVGAPANAPTAGGARGVVPAGAAGSRRVAAAPSRSGAGVRKIRLSQEARDHTLGAGYTGAMRPVASEHVAHKIRSANPLSYDIRLPRFRQSSYDPASIIPTGPVPSQRTRVTPPIVENLESEAEQERAEEQEWSSEGVYGGDLSAGGFGAADAGETAMWVALAQSDVSAAQRRPDAPLDLLDSVQMRGDLSVPTFDQIVSAHRGGVPVAPEAEPGAASGSGAGAGAVPFAAAPDARAQVGGAAEGALGYVPRHGSPDDGWVLDDAPRDVRDDGGSDASEGGREDGDAGVEGEGAGREEALPHGTDAFAAEPLEPEGERGGGAAAQAAPSPEGLGARIGSSALVISVCVMISRITGFIRTWAMGFAMGTTLLSSSYQVACNLPNQLYELVMGGMLVTAFLPVYMSLKAREGQRRASEYASTLLGIVVVALGAISVLCSVFAPQVVYTQMFLNSAGDRELVTYFFRFFAIQLLFYGISAVLGGILNAERDYLWSSAAPIANNVVVIAVMIAYVFIAPGNPDLGIEVIAIGTPLGVLTQMLILVPPIVRSGVRLRPRIDLHDPALRETLSLGLATIVVTVCSFVTVSVQNSAAMAVNTAGSSVLYYARQWFTLPYAFLSVPLTTTLFTELSDMAARGDREAVRESIVLGSRQSLFFMVPFALYLMTFAVPLVSLFCAGEFTEQSVRMVADYLRWMAVSLPFYALFMFMQKAFSAIRRMRFYAIVNVVVSVIQVVFTLLLPLGVGPWGGMGIDGIAVAQTMFFAFGDVGCYLFLRRYFGRIGMRSILRCALVSLALGAAGSAVGALVLAGLGALFGPVGSSIAKALAYVVAGGLPALAVTYGLSLALHVPESRYLSQVFARFRRVRC